MIKFSLLLLSGCGNDDALNAAAAAISYLSIVLLTYCKASQPLLISKQYNYH
jgi:hypothetical protein